MNSQMLARFASDKAVTRLIIVDKGDGDAIESGKIVYNGPPGGMSDDLISRLGDGYKIDVSMEATIKQTVSDIPESKGTSNSSGVADSLETDAPKQILKPADTDDTTTPKEETEPSTSEPANPKDEEGPKKGTIVGGVISYCRRMGPWIILSAGGMIATQAAELGLYAWYEHWAKDTFNFGFRKNYLIASASQTLRLLPQIVTHSDFTLRTQFWWWSVHNLPGCSKSLLMVWVRWELLSLFVWI